MARSCSTARGASATPRARDALHQIILQSGHTRIGTIDLNEPQYKAFLDAARTPGEELYANTPLAALGKATTGKMGERAQQVLLKLCGCDITHAARGVCVDGSARGANSTACDFQVDALKAEAKSAKMYLDGKCWKVGFECVKLEAHDLLYLACLFPSGIHVFLYRAKKDEQGEWCGHGLSNKGVSTESGGRKIQFYSSVNDGPEAAETRLLDQMSRWHQFTYVGVVPFGDGDRARVLDLGRKSCKWLVDTDAEAAAEAGAGAEASEDDEEEGEDDSE